MLIVRAAAAAALASASLVALAGTASAEVAAPCTVQQYGLTGAGVNCVSGYTEVGAGGGVLSGLNGVNVGQRVCYGASVPGNQECISHSSLASVNGTSVFVLDGVSIYSTGDTFGYGYVGAGSACAGVFSQFYAVYEDVCVP